MKPEDMKEAHHVKEVGCETAVPVKRKRDVPQDDGSFQGEILDVEAKRNQLEGEGEVLRIYNTSSDFIRQQINDTLIKRSNLLMEFRKHPVCRIEKKVIEQPSQLSQSEFHLNINFDGNDLRSKVSNALDSQPSFSGKLRRQRPELVEKLTNLIKIEKENPDLIYFYHACDQEVAFLYQIYTMIHRILQADEKWFVLRGSNQFFDGFENIQQFFGRYAKFGQFINNNDVDFHERAIAANVFLFGNHQVEGSNSISYFLGGRTARKIDLRAILGTMFHSLNIASPEIISLLELFAQYKCGEGGVIYQLSMSREQAQEMSYSAGVMGVFNRYDDSLDIVHIMSKLQEKADRLSADDKVFCNGLQARVLVPPAKLLGANVVRCHDLKPSQFDDLTKKMQSVLKSIVSNILINSHRLDPAVTSLHKTPLFRLQTALYGVNDCQPILVTPSVQELADAISEKNVLLVHAILKQCPTLLYEPVTAKYRNFHTNQWVKPVELVSSDFYEHVLPYVPEPQLMAFLQSIGFDRMLSELTQVIFRKNDESTTQRILKMKALLESIPENFRGDYLLRYDYSHRRMSQFKLGLVDWSKEVLEFPDCLKMCCDVLSATDRQDIMTRWIEKCAHHYENHDPIMDQLIESMTMAEADYNSTQLEFILMHDALLDKLLQKYPEGLQRTEKIEQYQLLMLTYNHHHRHKALKKLLACYPAEQHVAVIEKAYAMHASAQSPGAALLNMLRTVVSEEQHKMLVNCLINGQRFLFHVMKERNLSLFNWCLSLYTEHELMTLAREINLVREPGFGIRTKFCCGNMLLIAANLKVELLLAILEKLPAHDRLSALTVDTSIQALVGKYGAQCPELVKEAEDPNLIRFFQREVYPASPFSIISNNINVLHHVFKLLPDELYFDAFKRISVDCLKKLATKPEFISFMKEVVKRLDLAAYTELLADQTRSGLLPPGIIAELTERESVRFRFS